jgi:hypothetical protein
MFDHDLQIRVGSVATDFFLNLIAVAALVALPIMIPFTGSPPVQPVAATSRTLTEVRGEREAAERRLAQINSESVAAADAAAKADRVLAATASELQGDLARATEQNAVLANRVAEARATTRASSFGIPLSRDTDKKAVFFILANGLLTPVNKDAGRFAAINVNGGLVVFTPSLAGDPVASVAEGNGVTARAVASISPDKEFAFVFLRDDSFGAFYQLRGVLQQRGIGLGWAPLTAANRQVMFATGNNGRHPDIED